MSQGGTNEKRKHREPRGGGRNSSGTPGGGVVFTSCQQPTTTEPETARHTVTFDSKGGTEIAPVTVEDGKTVAKPETDPAKNGYDFGGWQNGEAEYDFSAAVKSDLALTAKWTAHAYTITYELNGGTNSSDNPDKYTIESEDITLKDPTGPAAALVFQGWYSDKDFQNRVSPAVIAKGSTGDKTFYARFGAEALKEFTVTFNVVAEAGGAVLGSDSIKVNDGDKISDAQLEAAKAKIASLGEYEYDGLYTDAALAAAFDTSTKITADTALYVKVKAVQKFTVTFDSDGGSAVAAVTVKSGEKAAKPADPAKDGYTFKGWLLGDAEYNFDAPVTGNITLKAKWEAKTFTVTFEGLEAKQTVEYGNTATEPADKPTKDGFTFDGWDFDFSTPIKADTEVKAKWGYTVWVAETSKEYTAGEKYGQIIVYNDAANAFAVGAGDWLIVSATVKFENIGQTYAGLGFTKTGAESVDYPNLDGFYTKSTGTNSTDYYVIYKFADAGKVHFISFNNSVAVGDKKDPVALAKDKTVTLENLKIVHVASDKVDTVFTKIVKEDSVTANWKNEESGNPGAYEYAPTVNFNIKAGSKLSVIYARPEIADSYKSHYVNSVLGWEASYPDKKAQTISKSILVSENKTVNWLQIGIQCTKTDDTMTFTDLEIRVIPGMDSFN